MQKNTKYNSRGGFTLVETLVAIFVIVTALTAAYSAAQASLKSSTRARDQVVAFYLAQEGFELVKNVRDSNVQARLDWLDGLDSTCVGDTCRISAFGSNNPKDTIDFCEPTGTSCVLQQDSDGRFLHTVGEDDSRFERYFTIRNSAVDEIEVEMTIEWVQGANEYSFGTTEYIANWRF